MALFHLHDDFAASTGESRFALARALAWFVGGLKTIHEAIVAARTCRLHRELMLHGDLGGEPLDEVVADRPLAAEEIAKLPRRPMILGDKWDF
jgi:hypothetical protein